MKIKLCHITPTIVLLRFNALKISRNSFFSPMNVKDTKPYNLSRTLQVPITHVHIITYNMIINYYDAIGLIRIQ